MACAGEAAAAAPAPNTPATDATGPDCTSDSASGGDPDDDEITTGSRDSGAPYRITPSEKQRNSRDQL
jgi:hypothetical protein